MTAAKKKPTTGESDGPKIIDVEKSFSNTNSCEKSIDPDDLSRVDRHGFAVTFWGIFNG